MEYVGGHRRLALLPPLLVLAVCWSIVVAYGDAGYTEYEVKAAMLMKFGPFVTWPAEGMPEGDEAICLGILGEDPFGKILEKAVAGCTVKRRRCRILRSKQPADLKACQIVFVCASEREKQEAYLAVFEGKPVLTIGDNPDFCEAGGMINLRMEGEAIRFDIHLEAVQRAGLKISSELLKLAKIVGEGEHEEREQE